ncbi:CRISPR-associated protein Csm4 [Candidatus Methanomarinus sp.]|nr:CRISPR-associated protein Csm4 [ANME-2 cluster archaeon]
MIIHIEPKSSFQGLSSDTIYGATFSAIYNLYEDFDEMLELFKQTPPFLISSAFPFVFAKETTHFFPKPIEGSQQKMTMIDGSTMKKMKSVKYIHESIFNQWIDGKTNEYDLASNIDKYLIKDGLMYPKKLNLNFSIKSLDIARNSINRQTQFTDIFYSSGNYYTNAGLFFLVRFMNNESEKKYSRLIKGVFKFLRDRGFGGDVSSGKGHFEITDFSDTEIIQEPEKGNRFISLSRYHPTQDEIAAYNRNRDIWYDIFTKRGRSSDGRIRNQVRFFTEGSTFPDLNKEVYGKTIYVARDAVEFGYAFNIRMR